MTEREPWRPNWTIAPGEIIAEMLAEWRVSERLAAKWLGITPADLAALLTGDLALTDDMAHQLKHVFQIPVTVWLLMERTYRAGLARGLSAVENREYLTGPAYSGKAS